MSRRYCPPWCVPTLHDFSQDVHRSAPVEVVTKAERFVVHIESGADGAYLVLAHYYEPMDAEDVPDFEPDNLVALKLATGAELVAAISSLTARALGGAR